MSELAIGTIRTYAEGSSHGTIPSVEVGYSHGTIPKPRVVYLAGPYRPYMDSEGVRHGIAENVKEAGKLGIELWKRGYVALVPHTLTYFPPHIRQDGSIRGVSAQAFMDGELELVRRSDALVLMPNWRISQGATLEKLLAEELGIPVYEWEEFVRADARGSR